MGESMACGRAVCPSRQTTAIYRAPKHCLERAVLTATNDFKILQKLKVFLDDLHMDFSENDVDSLKRAE
jgi:hypothetical protein